MNRRTKAIDSAQDQSISMLAGTSTHHEQEQRTSRLRRLESVPLRFLRFQAVRDRTGLSRSTIWRLERRGEFPRHRRISSNAVGWLEQEIEAWMLTKLAG